MPLNRVLVQVPKGFTQMGVGLIPAGNPVFLILEDGQRKRIGLTARGSSVREFEVRLDSDLEPELREAINPSSMFSGLMHFRAYEFVLSIAEANPVEDWGIHN